MRIISIALFRIQHQVASSMPDTVRDLPIMLCSAFELSSFGYFQRSGVREMTTFFSRTFVRQTDPGFRKTIKHQEYNCHIFVATDELAGVIFADEEYPPRVAFTVLSKVMDDFRGEFKSGSWRQATVDNSCVFPMLDDAIQRYQDPHNADALLRIMKDLDETKVILHKTIDSALTRGQKLDELIEKSNDLSSMSKSFYKQSKDLNRCSCVIL
eukprot:c26048_g1_i1.p1 GENE.c26048_g1_i1~~c26048_g1_i1.p1  ORF type:complete len:212 (+),score=44.85 c26048_g1_i1:87-722(+)